MPPYIAVTLGVVLAFMAGLVVAAYLHERRATLRYRAERDADRAELVRVKEQRDTVADHMTTTRKVNTRLTKQVEELTRRIANMERVSRSPLYQEALENKQANHVQAALQIRLAEESLAAAKRVLNGDVKP